MVVNPAGPQPVWDGGIPRTITARVFQGITGGQLVYLSGTSNSVSSGVNSYVTNDIIVGGGLAGSGRFFNGICITPGNTASGTLAYATIAMGGTFIITAAGTILAGDAVYCNGDDAIIAGDNSLVAGSYVPIGRAITPAGSEGYTVVKLF